MTFAKPASAKSYDFDDKDYETNTDYSNMMKIVKAARYRGWAGIDYEEGRVSEGTGILATKKLPEKTRKELA